MSESDRPDLSEEGSLEENREDVLMAVKGLMLDPGSNVPIVILQDESGEKTLPIWIGTFEANAIAMHLEEVTPPRPMTHDLLAGLLGDLQATLHRVLICDLRDNTFFAQLSIESEGAPEVEMDARPSDAIALALRLGTPIYVRQSVLDKAQMPEVQESLPDDQQIREWLEQADSEDFGKYEM